ncbi:uncharacterized protein [Dysidea avara]|uniref:uncharacterized protein isoform X2 n=1 Tax=Dysidea avara TaxID=196820 RepID=UPI00332183E9
MAKVVTFQDADSQRVNTMAIAENKSDNEASDDSGDDFCEITTSEGEPYNTSDEEDAEFLQMALESVYACSPRKTREAAERSSYLLLDKDFVEDEDDIDDLDHESAVSEISLCASGVGCGTTTSDDEEPRLPPRKKRKMMTRSKATVSTDVDGREHPEDKDNTKGKGGKGRKRPQHQNKGKKGSKT